MKQTSPVPMQSPAAIPELPFTLCSICDHMLLGAVQMGEPSEPRTARITPCVSTRFPAPLDEKLLNTTAGAASFGCRRITTGVLITCTKSGYSRSGRTLRLWVVSSGPRGVVKGHHQARSGGSKEPCGMKMQAGSAGSDAAVLHLGIAIRQRRLLVHASQQAHCQDRELPPPQPAPPPTCRQGGEQAAGRQAAGRPPENNPESRRFMTGASGLACNAVPEQAFEQAVLVSAEPSAEPASAHVENG